MVTRPKEASGGGVKDAAVEKVDARIHELLVRFGRQIRDLRKSKRVTQKKIEERTGLTSGALSKIENGQRAMAFDSVLKVALALEMQPSELVMLLDDKPRSDAARGTVVNAPIIIGPGVDPETVTKLIREFDDRVALSGKPAGRGRG